MEFFSTSLVLFYSHHKAPAMWRALKWWGKPGDTAEQIVEKPASWDVLKPIWRHSKWRNMHRPREKAGVDFSKVNPNGAGRLLEAGCFIQSIVRHSYINSMPDRRHDATAHCCSNSKAHPKQRTWQLCNALRLAQCDDIFWCTRTSYAIGGHYMSNAMSHL